MGLIAGLIMGLIIGLITGLNNMAHRVGLIGAHIAGFLMGLIAGLIAGLRAQSPVRVRAPPSRRRTGRCLGRR